MARHTKMKVLNSINDIGVVPVFYNGDIDVLKNVASSCAAGGILLLEITNRGDLAWEVFSE